MVEKKDKVLDLPMRKVHALDILRGEKVREYRWLTDHWAARLGECNNPDNPYEITGCKHYDRVHFHDYRKTWWLDAEITDISLFNVNEDFIADLSAEIDAKIGDAVFVISLGKVLGTSLKLNE